MPIYKAKIWFMTHITREIEAKDEEEALYNCVLDGVRSCDMPQAIDHLEALEYNNEVELSDNQYTDQQELGDRERDHDRKDKDNV